MKSFVDPVFTMGTAGARIVFQIVADPLLRPGTTPTATDDDAPHRVIRISAADADDHECDEPDRLAAWITDAAIMGRSTPADMIASIRQGVHEWLCERRSEAAARDHEG